MGTRGCRRRARRHSTGLALVAAVVAGVVVPASMGSPVAAEATVIGSFTVDQAFATAVDEARDRVYVTRIGTPAIYAYDSNTFALVGVRTIANFPVTVEVNDVTGNVMVAHQGDGNKVTVLNSALNTLAVLELPNPWGPAVNSVTNRFYVANTFGGDVWVVDGASNALLTTINLDGDSTLGIAVDESRNRIYAADRYSNELDVIDGTTNTVIDTLATGSYPAWIDIDEVLGTVYVTNQDDGTISVFDAGTLAPVGTIEVGGSPHRIAVNDTTHRAYVSLQNSDRVAVIDTATNAVVSEVVLPAGQPWHLSLDESTNRVFVPTYFANRVVVIQGDEPSEAIATSTSVVTSANPAPVNAPIMLTATVAAATGPVVPTGAVTFTIDGVAQAPIPLTGGAAALTISSLGLGSHQISASYAPAGSGFLPSDSSAAPLIQVIEPGPLAAISLSPATSVVGTNTPQPFSVAGFDAYGNALGDQTAGATFSISPNGTCTLNSCRATTTGTKVVTATVGSLTATATLDVRVRQTITFPTISAKTMLQSPVTVSATASSGLPVSFTSTTPAVCAAGGPDGSTITLLAQGTCTVRADQAGDATRAPAPPLSRSFAVSRASQTITFPTQIGRAITESPVTVTATSSSGLAVTFTTATPAVCTATGAGGSTIVLLDAGTCTVRAEQAGDGTYNPAPAVSRNFTVTKLANTITFPTIGTRTLAETPLTVTAVASSGLPVTFSTTTPAVCTVAGTTVDLLTAGSCTVRAEQAGDAVYRAATPVNRTFTVAKVAQSITFAALPTRNISQSPITVFASASSGLPVTFTTTTPAVCTAGGADGSSITLVATGTCTVRAAQSGDAYWRAATAVSRSFTVTLPPPAIQTFTASVASLGSAGGAVELSAAVTDAATCRFTASPAVTGLPVTVTCSGGTAVTTVNLPANTGASARTYTFNMSALRTGAPTATAVPVVVTVDAS